MAVISLREYGRRRNLTHTAIAKQIRAGRLVESVVRDASGKITGIIPDLADREWDNEVPSQINHIERREAASPAAAGTEPGAEPVGAAAPSYNRSRAFREAYNARIAKLEYEERVGTLVNADEVRAEAFKLARSVRDSLLNIPDRLAAVLAGESDARHIHMLLTDEIRKALEGLTDAR